MAKSTVKTLPGEAPSSFESAIKELERLVESLESGDLALEQALAAHKRGLELAKYCSETLGRAEAEVKILEGELLKTLPLEREDDEDGDDSE